MTKKTAAHCFLLQWEMPETTEAAPQKDRCGIRSVYFPFYPDAPFPVLWTAGKYFCFFSITVPEQRPQPAVDFRDKIGIFRKKPHRVPPAPRKQAVLRDASDNSGGFLASELRPLSSPAGGHWGRVSLSLEWCRNFSVTPLNDGIS